MVTWDGGGGANSNWSLGLNWAGDVPPAANDAVVFDGSAGTTPVNDLTAGTAVASLDFAATAASFIVAGNSISLGGGITVNSPLPQTVNLPIVLTAAHTVNVTSGGSLTLGGAISGSGTFTKAGDGFGADQRFDDLQLERRSSKAERWHSVPTIRSEISSMARRRQSHSARLPAPST
jgi:hypothetical protein